MLKKKIVGILLVGLLVGTIFAGCVEKEEKEVVKPEEIIMPEEIRIKPEEIIKGIEGATIQKVGESKEYAICNIEFIGEKEARIKGTLFIPFKPNGAGIIIHSAFGEPRDLPPAKSFARTGYVALAYDYRGVGKSEGYLNDKSLSMDVSRIAGILGEILENLEKQAKRLPGSGKVGVYGHGIGAQVVMRAATLDPEIKVVAVADMLEITPHGTLVTVSECIKQRKNPVAILFRGSPTAMLRNIHIFPLSSHSVPAITNLLGYFVGAYVGYPPRKLSPQIDVPIIYLTGENNIEIPLCSWELVFDRTASTQKKLVVMPGVDDVFLTPEGESHAEEAYQIIIDWMDSHLLKKK
jgi:pimeloyl-ACP methyl ester carboxylesterase